MLHPHPTKNSTFKKGGGTRGRGGGVLDMLGYDMVVATDRQLHAAPPENRRIIKK